LKHVILHVNICVRNRFLGHEQDISVFSFYAFLGNQQEGSIHFNWSIRGSRTQLEQMLIEGTRQLCQDMCISMKKEDFCVGFAFSSLWSLPCSQGFGWQQKWPY